MLQVRALRHFRETELWYITYIHTARITSIFSNIYLYRISNIYLAAHMCSLIRTDVCMHFKMIKWYKNKDHGLLFTRKWFQNDRSPSNIQRIMYHDDNCSILLNRFVWWDFWFARSISRCVLASKLVETVYYIQGNHLPTRASTTESLASKIVANNAQPNIVGTGWCSTCLVQPSSSNDFQFHTFPRLSYW